MMIRLLTENPLTEKQLVALPAFSVNFSFPLLHLTLHLHLV